MQNKLNIDIYKETLNRSNTTVIFFNKTLRYDCVTCILNVVCFYGLQTSVVKHFSVNSIKSELGNIEKLEF